MSALTLKGATLPEILLNLETCTRWGARFVAPNEEATFYPYQDVLRRAQKTAAALQARGLQRGDRVALILSTSIEFFDSLLGVQLAGGIPAALYPPFRLGKLDEYFARLRKMLAKIGAKYLITEEPHPQAAGSRRGGCGIAARGAGRQRSADGRRALATGGRRSRSAGLPAILFGHHGRAEGRHDDAHQLAR